MKHRLLLAVITFLSAGFLFIQPVAANDVFRTSLNSTYNVGPTGSTQVTHVITLTNLTPAQYISRYALKINSPEIDDVQVLSNGEVLVPETVRSDNQTSIGLTFPDIIAGQGKERVLEITYRDPDVAVLSGQVLEVLVPKLASANEYDEYTVTIVTPERFGPPTRVTPPSFTVNRNNNTYVTQLVLEGGNGVTALYGQDQIFDFQFIYDLINDSPNTGLAQIALPPDTANQKLQYDKLNPRPQSITTDIDGNWIATYQVPAETTLRVNADGKVLVTLDQVNDLASPATLDPWLKGDTFWELQDSRVQEAAQAYPTAKNIYDYVVETLDYNYANLETDSPRLGASKTLETPNFAACQEFTDTFVAIARAAGIPARRVTGYAHTQNPLLRPLNGSANILHAWPEYYDRAKNQWIPVDPTWGNTTGGVNYFDQFDLNHVVLAINGKSSTLPLPVGSYAADDIAAEQAINITFGDTFSPQQPQLEIKPSLERVGGIPIPGRNKIEITNLTGEAWYNLQLLPEQVPAGYTLPSSLDVPVLLPFQTVSVIIPVYHDDWLTTTQIPLQLTANYEETFSQERHTIPLESVTLSVGGQVFYLFGQPIFAVALGTVGFLCALAAGSILVRRRRRSRSVRRKS